MKKIITIAVILMSLLSTACNQNILKTMPKEKLIAVLLQAARHAEKKMNLYSPPGGGHYLSCMSANEAQVDCDRFFSLMLSALKQTEPFKSVTLAQLTDRQLFATVALDYQTAFFNTIED